MVHIIIFIRCTTSKHRRKDVLKIILRTHVDDLSVCSLYIIML